MDWRRERNRKERAKAEMEAMIARYEKECGEAITRPATEEDLNKFLKALNQNKNYRW